MLVLVISVVICGALGYAVAGSTKKGLGTLLGALLGPLGILIAVFACKD